MNYYFYDQKVQSSERFIADLTFALQDIVKTGTVLITSKTNVESNVRWIEYQVTDRVGISFYVGTDGSDDITIFNTLEKNHIVFNIKEKIVALMKAGKHFLPYHNESESSFVLHLIDIMIATQNKLNFSIIYDSHKILDSAQELVNKIFHDNMMFYLSLFYNCNNFNCKKFIEDSINYYKDGGNSELYHRANSFKGVIFFQSNSDCEIKVPVLSDYVKPGDLMIEVKYYFVSSMQNDIGTETSLEGDIQFKDRKDCRGIETKLTKNKPYYVEIEKTILHKIDFIIKHLVKMTKLDNCSVLINNICDSHKKSKHTFIVYWNGSSNSDIVVVIPDKSEIRININEYICSLIMKGYVYDIIENDIIFELKWRICDGPYKLRFSSLEKVIKTKKITQEDLVFSEKSWAKSDYTVESFLKYFKFFTANFDTHAYLNYNLDPYYNDSVAYLTNGDEYQIDLFLKKNDMKFCFVLIPDQKNGNMLKKCPYPNDYK